MIPYTNRAEKADSYWWLHLTPKRFAALYKATVVVKGDKLAQFIADVGDDYTIEVFRMNYEGFVSQPGLHGPMTLEQYAGQDCRTP